MLGRVRGSYQRQAADLLWIVIDAARPADVVAADVATAVERRLGPQQTRTD
jgi:thymidylate kinase